MIDRPDASNAAHRRQLETALAHQQNGRPDAAREIYETVLTASPGNTDALHLMGALLFQSYSNAKDATELVKRAIALNAKRPDYYNTLGILYRSLNLSEQSSSALMQATALAPEYAEAWNNLGAVREDMGALVDAATAYESALQADPGLFQARLNLGRLLLLQTAYDQAAKVYKLAVELSPNNVQALFGYGVVLEKQNQLSEAVAIFQRVLEISPDSSSAHSNLALLFLKQGRISDAKDTHAQGQKRTRSGDVEEIEYLRVEAALCNAEGETEKAIKAANTLISLEPKNVENYLTLSLFQQNSGNLPDAESTLRAALAITPEDLDAQFNLAIILQRQGKMRASEQRLDAYLRQSPDNPEAHRLIGMIRRSSGNLAGAAQSLERALILDSANAEILGNLAAVRQDQGRGREAIELFQKSVNVNPASQTSQSNLLMSLNYRSQSPDKLFDAHRWWASAMAPDNLNNVAPVPLASKVRRSGRVRIGYVSGDFRQHSVAYFLEPVLENHDKTQVEVFCYAAMDNPDSVTTRLKRLSNHWRYIYSLNDTQLASCVARDEIDILVDLSGHTANNRLPAFARRLAPIQVSWLGYPNTTGLDSMDYRLTDAIADPHGAEAHHSETLVRLQHGFLSYRPLETSPEISPSPYLQSGAITFGSFNNAAKISSEVVAAWSSILSKMPNSRLFLKSRQFADSGVNANLFDKFHKNGVDPSRITLIGRTESLEEHLTLYKNIDIALDTFPYNGTTTTCEAMWMGIPTISLRGNRHAGRVGASLLSRVGLEFCIAESVEGYIESAIALAEKRARLSDLRRNLRTTMKNSTICDAKNFTLNLESVYRQFLTGYRQ